MAHIISKACTKCGACLSECPTGSITEGKNQFFIDADTCSDHASCANVCPVEAISLRQEGSQVWERPDEEEEET